MNKPASIFHYFRPYRRSIVLALLGTVVVTVLSILPPLLMRFLVDKVLAPGQWDLLPLAAAMLIGLPALASVLRFINVFVLMKASHRFIADMRIALYRKVMHLSMRFFGQHSSGTIAGRIMDDVNMLQRLLTSATIQTVVDLIVFVAAIFITFSISWKLSCILYSLVFFYIFIFKFFSKRIRKSTELYRAEYDLITGRLQEVLSGVRQIRIFNREEHETSLFLDRLDRGLQNALSGSMNSVFMDSLSVTITGYGSTIIMLVGAFYVLYGSMSYGDILAFGNFVWMAISPAMNLANLAGDFQETFVSVRRVMDIVNETSTISPNFDKPNLPRGAGHVAFENVGFSYIPDVPLFEDLSLSVKPGTTVALVGPTGCGKTTLLQLMMRYWDIRSGCIRIDGVDIRSVRLHSLRDLFGVVLQAPMLFDETIAQNIAYGRPQAPLEKIVEAAKVAEIYETIMELPGGFETVIGTHGIKLSVGEKQRISIARAVLKDPMILVMDEATSALDSESESLIQKALAAILKERTSFVIAHRLTTITSADQILVMENGRIIDRGTHEELMDKGVGLYRTLYMELAG